MTTATNPQLAYGLRRAIPEGVEAVWGARFIAPNDLPYNRQDLVATSDEAKQRLIAWLNGPGAGDGAIQGAIDTLRSTYQQLIEIRDGYRAIYEDDEGVIYGSTNNWSGYVYAVGYLKADAPGHLAITEGAQ
jgi:hypothetical protein